MKKSTKLCLLTMLACATAGAETGFFAGDAPQAAAAPAAADPAYRFVEGISDGVYDFMRLHVIGSILPERLTRNLKAAPKDDSSFLFDRNLHDKEMRYLARARAAYPIYAEGHPPTDAQIQAWRSWAAAEQISVGVDAIGDTLVSRYQLEMFGTASGSYAKDRRNWDPGFLSMAGVLGGTFLYLNGMHASAHVGAFKLGIDLASGLRLRKALQSRDETNRLAAIELGFKNLPVSATSEFGTSNHRVRTERVGLVYRLRY